VHHGRVRTDVPAAAGWCSGRVDEDEAQLVSVSGKTCCDTGICILGAAAAGMRLCWLILQLSLIMEEEFSYYYDNWWSGSQCVRDVDIHSD
jgi:hypothetical protein